MSELESVLEAFIAVIGKSGVRTLREYPAGPAKLSGKTAAAVGVSGAKVISAGFAEYLGEETEDTGESFEVYGKRLELEIGVSVYSPREKGAQGCLEAAGAVTGALMELPAGVRIGSVAWEETSFDSRTGLYLMNGKIQCLCVFRARRQDEDELLTFTLRGVLK